VFPSGPAQSCTAFRTAYRKWGLALLTGLSIGLTSIGIPARTSSEPALQQDSSLPTVALSALPSQAQETHRLVRQGGPFPYSKDGSVFFNRERLLPGKARGYYREYTVPTPGSRDRGARRIVSGGDPPEVFYYTDDHYRSFREVEMQR
jgi:guanyl-specific ribonuclease Sa